MLDRITYIRPSYVEAISRVASVTPSRAVTGKSFDLSAPADSWPAKNQAKAASPTTAGNTVIPFPLNQQAYLGTRKVGLNTSVSNASAAYGKTAEDNIINEKLLKRQGLKECQTCSERRYQDESGDSGVSFKTPAHVAPENAGAAVAAHEQEHVRNEQVNAARDKRRIISQSVQIFTSSCPECGKIYVSGGETRTVSAAVTQSNPISQKGQFVDKYA